MAYPVLTTMLMHNKDVDAMNRVAFIGSVAENKFTGVACNQGSIVSMTEMCKFSSDTAMHKEGYAWIAGFPQAQTQTDLWIVDNHEVGYTVAYQTMAAIDPREFTNEANRAVSVRKLRKHDIIQISKDAFTITGTTPDVPSSTKTIVELAANGKLKAVAPGQGTKEIFKVLGMEKMEFGAGAAGDALYDAWILEYIAD